jgi:putative peptidoglycan binding protein
MRIVAAAAVLATAAVAVAASPVGAAPAKPAPSVGVHVTKEVNGGLVPTHASQAQPAGSVTSLASCHYSTNASQSFSFNGTRFLGFGYAGHYSGLTAVPSTTQVTSAGVEAQCMLARYGFYNPGGIDGVFGRNSQAAMHQFQIDMNNIFGAGLATGPGQDLPGPNSWKWLRWWQQ